MSLQDKTMLSRVQFRFSRPVPSTDFKLSWNFNTDMAI